MKSLYINEIEEENIQTLLDFVCNTEEKIHIYIDSHGGSCHLFTIFLNVINKNKDRIVLYASGFLDSMAFHLFFRYEGERCVLPYATARLHYSGGDVRIMSNGKIEYREEKIYKKYHLENYNFEKELFEKLNFSKKELSELENGDDFILPNSRLIELNKKL